MFGLVPKPIWSKQLPSDERNRIRQNANVLLVEWDNGRKGLFDTGCGDPGQFDEKTREQQAIGTDWPLRDALDGLGITTEEIEFVVLTHLHWDHAGGIGSIVDGELVLTFPRAHVYIHEQEWADAISGDPLLYKSYPADTIEPLQRISATQRRLVRDNHPEIFPGIRLIRSGGHTRGHCVIELEDRHLVLHHPEADALHDCTRLIFAGDVCPTAHHLRMVFQTAYDTYPLDTRRWKKIWLPRIASGDTALFFDHDPDLFAARIQPDERREFVVRDVLPVL